MFIFQSVTWKPCLLEGRLGSTCVLTISLDPSMLHGDASAQASPDARQKSVRVAC